jgi:glucan phosphoethanolaminetransferase (alkaline phosphatase superfamily)
MEERSFFSYLFNKVDAIGGVVGFLIIIYNFIKKNPLLPSVCVVLGIFCVMLLFSLNKIFTDLKKYKSQIEFNNSELIKTKNNYEELQIKFNQQSRQYARNINELNQHKKITHVVETVINSIPPKTDEGKKLISMLTVSIEKSLKESD